MQFIKVNSSEDNTDSISVSYIPNESYLYPKFYLSYDKMQKEMSRDEDRVKKRVADFYYIRVVDSWLYHDYRYKELTKYFNIKYDGKKISVSLERSLQSVGEKNYSSSETKNVLFFIETFFVSKKFIRKVVNEYARRTSAKWYELYSYEYNIKEFIRHQLKKKIKHTIHEMQKTEINK